MSNSDTDSNTSENTDSKKRGRKKIVDGGKSSPRYIFCICAASINGDLVVDEIFCKDSNKETSDEDVVKEAEAIFTKTYGEPPMDVYGPYFQRKGGKQLPKSDRISGLSLETASFVTGKLGTAVYKGWNVSVRFVQDYEDAVYIMYKNHTNEDKKTKPQNKFVRSDALMNLDMKGTDFVANAS